jgi:hypothetical protein
MEEQQPTKMEEEGPGSFTAIFAGLSRAAGLPIAPERNDIVQVALQQTLSLLRLLYDLDLEDGPPPVPFDARW